VQAGHVHDVLDEIIRWSKVEFNYMEVNTVDAGSVADDDENE